MEKALHFFTRRSLERSFSFTTFGGRKKASTVQDDSFTHVKKRVLMDNFAEKLLNLELDMEQPNVDVQSVHKLLELYANGVEYYESIKSNRYQIFQDKIKNLLLRPNVIEALNSSKPKETQSNREEEVKIKSKEQKELDMSLYLMKQKSNDEDIKYILNEKKNKVKEINNIIENQISSQKNSILDRLELRKQNKLSHCSSQPLFSSPQLPPRRPSIEKKSKFSSEIKETDEEHKENADFESKKRKRKSILMLRKVSNELNSMLESINLGRDSKGSVKKLPLGNESSEKKKDSFEQTSMIFQKIEEETHENQEKNPDLTEKSSQNSIENNNNHNGFPHEDEFKENKEKNIECEYEKTKKIEEIKEKFQAEIDKLEKQLGQNKNSILISKMIEKVKKNQEQAIQDLYKNS